jgi:hypothetical protein
MKKTFPLKASGQADDRVVESIKHEVRKYVKRERRKPVTTGVDFWDFNCRVGHDQLPPGETHISAVTDAIDAAAKTEGVTSVYVEILAKPGVRTPKPKPVDPAAIAADTVGETPAGEVLTAKSPGESGYIAPSEATDENQI